MERTVAYIAAAVVAVALVLFGLHGMGFRFDPFNTAGKAKAAAVTATQGQAVAQAAVPVVERFHETQVRIITQSEKAAADVQRLPTADSPLDPLFAAGLRGMLDPTPVAPGPDRPGEP